MIQGVGPVYAKKSGFDLHQVSMFMALAMVGGAIVQFPGKARSLGCPCSAPQAMRKIYVVNCGAHLAKQIQEKP